MKTATRLPIIEYRGLLGVMLVALAGCAEELGPEPMPTAPVSGQVLLGGRPVPGGWLEFLPVDGTVGRLRSARVGPDGRFRADGVPRGRVAIRIVGGPLPPGDAALFGQRYLIRRAIPAGGTADLTIDLDLERRAIDDARPG